MTDSPAPSEATGESAESNAASIIHATTAADSAVSGKRQTREDLKISNVINAIGCPCFGYRSASGLVDLINVEDTC